MVEETRWVDVYKAFVDVVDFQRAVRVSRLPASLFPPLIACSYQSSVTSTLLSSPLSLFVIQNETTVLFLSCRRSRHHDHYHDVDHCHSYHC